MSALERVQHLLARLESRLRLASLARGALVMAAVAVLATLLLVWLADMAAFAPAAVSAARVALVVALGVAFGLAVAAPWLRVSGRRAARRAERVAPDLDQRLLTLAELPPDQASPFAELLAEQTLEMAARLEPGNAAPAHRIAAAAAGAALFIAALVWLVTAGPGFLGYGAGLLWTGPARQADRPFYQVLVEPGDRTIRRGSAQLITARLLGFSESHVRLLARFHNSSQWEQVDMAPQPGSSVFGFYFGAVPEPVDYYVDAGRVRSATFTLTTKDLPVVTKLTVSYRFPSWTGLAPVKDDPGGDVRAVSGTEAEIRVHTDRKLENGFLVVDSQQRVPLAADSSGVNSAALRVERAGAYYVAMMDDGEIVRLTEDYFIEPRQNEEPLLRISRPGRDAKVSPIEEVVIAVDAADDFGLREVELRYSVNGGQERSASLLSRPGARQADGAVTLYLEEFGLVPGDIVAFYATAKDAVSTQRTGIYFLEAQPFERHYSQSQVAGGAGGGGEGGQENRISQRQKEIIAATWNQINARRQDPAETRENGRFLAETQGKLRDQAASLARRIERRGLSATNTEFQGFSQDMEKAAQAMDEAVRELSRIEWRNALAPEQKALQHLLRAEATLREIQVAFGNRSGGRGGGGGRDLENLFDLELDTGKNQYEAGPQSAGLDQQNRELDEALRRLEELARRQQSLAARQPQGRQSFEQRWQQEMLRREAEQLRRQLEQMARSGALSQQGSASSAGGSSRGTAAGARAQRSGGVDPRVEKALENLARATEDMQRGGSHPDENAEARRAAERLREAQNLLGALRAEESSQRVDELADRSQRLAARQEDFARRAREAFAGKEGEGGNQSPQLRQQGEALAREKQELLNEYQNLERDLQSAARSIGESQRGVSSRLRQALAEAQQNELGLRMKYAAEYLRKGLGAYVWMREAPVTQGLRRLSDQIGEARSALQENPAGEGEMAKALAQVARLRAELERALGHRRRGQDQGQHQGQDGNQRQGEGQGQTGGQQASRQGGGAMAGGRGASGSGPAPGFSAMNRGDWQPAPPGPARDPLTGDGLERFFSGGLQELSRLRRGLRDDPELESEVQNLIREMERLNPKRFPGNQELVERLHSQALSGLEQLELLLRRKLQEGSSGQVRGSSAEPVPPGYAEAVAEYYRRLGQTRR